MNEFEHLGQKAMLLSGAPTLLPGTDVELRWDIEDNSELLRRRPPDPPALVCSFRLLSPEGLTALDGSMLRRARERLGVPLERVAAASGLSYGYLSNVERGVAGLTVNPGVLAAYRQVGVMLPGLAVGSPVPAAGERSPVLLTPAGWWRTRNNERRAERHPREDWSS